MNDLATIILAGLSTGATLTLIAVGFNITLIASGVLNFAYPNIIMVGGFIGYTLLTEHNVSVPVTVLTAGLLGLLTGAVEERIAIRAIRGTGGHIELVTTVGAATVITGIATLIWGTNPELVQFPGDTTSVAILGGHAGALDLAVIGLAVVLAIGIHLIMRHTAIGLACLATAEDREAAMLRRINVRRYSLWSFAISGLVAGLIGPLIAADTSASVDNALDLAVKAFIVLTIGGVGSQIGALWGGFVIGLLDAFVTFGLGTQYSDALIYVVFLIVLLFRPHGLFGRRQARTV